MTKALLQQARHVIAMLDNCNPDLTKDEKESVIAAQNMLALIDAELAKPEPNESKAIKAAVLQERERCAIICDKEKNLNLWR